MQRKREGKGLVMQLEVVKDYYGKQLKSSKDLKTSACCDGGNLPPHLQPLLANVHPEVASKYYGCGIVVPAERDTYGAAKQQEFAKRLY